MEVPVAVAGWANHATTFMSLIESYKTKELFCDCTLACDRKFFRAHKMILAMSSELFENIFLTTEDKNPVIILHEIEAWQVECLLNYMYKGETRVSDAHFISLCKVAKSLQIKGFDKLELYREAVKQSGRKDSRLITQNEDSNCQTSFSPTKENISPKSCYYLHEKEQLENTVNIFGYKALKKANTQRLNESSPSFRSTDEQQNSPPREPLSSPTSKKTSFSITQNLSLKSPPQSVRFQNEDPSTVSSSDKYSHLASSCYNFKKKYLLSMSQDLERSPKPHSPPMEETPSTPSHKPRSELFPCNDQSCSLSSVTSCKSDDLPPSEILSEAKSSSGQKPGRGPPPLLRIMYNSSPEDEEPKEVETASNQFKQENSSQFPYDYSLSYNRLPHLDDYFQTSLISEPWNDPLLQKIPTNKRKRVRGPKSWEFLLRLLRSPESNPSLIKWENEEAGVFRLIRPEIIALRWGRRTGKHIHDILSYESFSRGLRYHYATGALCAVSEKSFVYQFGPKAQDALKSTKQIKAEAPGQQ